MSNRPNFLPVVQYSFYIFEGNYYAFMRTLEGYRDVAFHKVQLIDLHLDGGRELSRLIHNYVESCLSLVDHSRSIKKRILTSEEASEFIQEYDEKVREDIVASVENSLVKDLRRYVHHKAALVPSLSFRGSLTEPCGMYFDVKTSSLSRFDWTAGSKEYLHAHDYLDLERIFTDHFKRIQGLYLWIEYKEQQMNEFASEEIKEMTFEVWKNTGLNRIIRTSGL